MFDEKEPGGDVALVWIFNANWSLPVNKKCQLVT